MENLGLSNPYSYGSFEIYHGKIQEAGGSPAAGHFPCAAKESNQRKAAPGVAPRIRGVTLCCLPRQGGCGTRPGEAHTTRLTAGLEQSSPTSPCRVELLGAPQGEPKASGKRLLPTAFLRATLVACDEFADRRGNASPEQSPWDNRRLFLEAST